MNLAWVQPIFAKGGKAIQTELMRLMNAQKGVDGSGYSPLAPETVAQKMKVSSVNADKRMIRTKDFLNHAFQFQIGMDNLRVFIADSLHSRELRNARKASTKAKLTAKLSGKGPASAQTYKNIAEWQLATGMAKFFPDNREEILNLSSVKQIQRDIQSEGLKQARQQLAMRLRVEVNLG